ncbi:hypothetical protein HER32_11085 [Hymenobacter sp. BT18]|uniref:hypothetical protein n=1 Tax=Hymenobacter sp. BT18 TaxID=2835648 RepID=UPI00143E4619|nr:hypothetical protein [Hymenobacter sp. BT18]QIX61693.1 hypothetical protein HER32_11085 [Hymenobacter sp. BT18]
MSHSYSLAALATSVLLAAAPRAQAQSIITGFMAGKGHGSVAVSGTLERYTAVYLVPEKVDAVPVFKKINVSSINLFANYGLSDKVEVVLSLPYIRSEGQADDQVVQAQGYTNRRQGFQDISAYLKFKGYSTEVGSSQLDLLGAVGVSTPLSNYQSAQGVQYIIAIGNRATKGTALGVAHLKTPIGVFLTGQAGYSLRSGRVPNAFLAEAKAGYAGLKLYVEGWISFQNSDKSGTDILQPGFDGNFTATRVDYARVGGSIFRPLAKGVGVVLGASTYVAGRNIGKSTAGSLGVAYNF